MNLLNARILLLQIQNWFETKLENCLSKETSSDETKKVHVVPDAIDHSKATENPKIPEGVLY